MKQKQFYFIYVFLLSMSFLGACSKDSPNELIPNTIVKIEIDELTTWKKNIFHRRRIGCIRYDIESILFKRNV